MRQIVGIMFAVLILGLLVKIAGAADVEMIGSMRVTGAMTATSFTGSGAGLTSVPGSSLGQSYRLPQGCSNNQIPKWNGTGWICTAATSGGTVTQVNTGGGLTGGPIIGSGTISIAPGGVSAASLADSAVTPAKIAFYGKLAIVAASGGDYDNPATAMADFADWCATPSQGNPCLLKIMPGIYAIGTDSVQMQPFIDMEGSGENTTVIEGSVVGTGAVLGAGNAELRFLTIRNTAAGTTSSAIYNNSASPKIMNVTAIASGGSMYNYGVNNNSSSPAMTNVTATASGGITSYGVYNDSSSPVMMNVTATASGGSNNNGVNNYSSSSPAMTNVTATASGSGNNYGANNYSSSPVMTNVTATASGGSSNSGVYNNSSSAPVMMNVTATASGGATSSNNGVFSYDSTPAMTNVTATASGGASSSNTGVYNYSSNASMTNVTATASGGESRGVYNHTSGTVKINHSLIRGSTNTIMNLSGVTTYIGNSQLDGGGVSNSGTLTCVGVYDENYAALGNNCQ
jgi:hypothetical protein